MMLLMMLVQINSDTDSLENKVNHHFKNAINLDFAAMYTKYTGAYGPF